MIPDTGRNLSILYTAANSPDELSARMSVLIDKDGIVRLIDRNVKVSTHGPDILAKMKEINFDKPFTQASAAPSVPGPVAAKPTGVSPPKPVASKTIAPKTAAPKPATGSTTKPKR